MVELKLPHWLSKSKKYEFVQLAPREFYVTKPEQVAELCEIWNQITSGLRKYGEWSFPFRTKAKSYAKLPDTMMFKEPEFGGHFIKFTENKKDRK